MMIILLLGIGLIVALGVLSLITKFTLNGKSRVREQAKRYDADLILPRWNSLENRLSPDSTALEQVNTNLNIGDIEVIVLDQGQWGAVKSQLCKLESLKYDLKEIANKAIASYDYYDAHPDLVISAIEKELTKYDINLKKLEDFPKSGQEVIVSKSEYDFFRGRLTNATANYNECMKEWYRLKQQAREDGYDVCLES